MKIKPLANRLLVEKLEKEKVGLIEIPAPFRDTNLGKILEVGPGQLSKKGNRIPLKFQTGQTIFYKRFAGIEIELEEKTCLLLRDNDILLTIDD